MSDTTYIVRKGSPVWVCRGELPFIDKPYKFIAHKMKRDLSFAPRVSCDGPGVIALACQLPLIIGRNRRHFSECFVEAKAIPDREQDTLKLFDTGAPVRLSFLDLLEKGMSLFATGIGEYPILAVFEQYVDEVDEEENVHDFKWVKQDLGDGLSKHTLHPDFQTKYPLRDGRRS